MIRVHIFRKHPRKIRDKDAAISRNLQVARSAKFPAQLATSAEREVPRAEISSASHHTARRKRRTVYHHKELQSAFIPFMTSERMSCKSLLTDKRKTLRCFSSPDFSGGAVSADAFYRSSSRISAPSYTNYSIITKNRQSNVCISMLCGWFKKRFFQQMSEIYTGKMHGMIYTVPVRFMIRIKYRLYLGDYYAQANRSRIGGNHARRGINLVFEKKRRNFRRCGIFIAVRSGHALFVAERSTAYRS